MTIPQTMVPVIAPLFIFGFSFLEAIMMEPKLIAKASQNPTAKLPYISSTLYDAYELELEPL